MAIFRIFKKKEVEPDKQPAGLNAVPSPAVQQPANEAAPGPVNGIRVVQEEAVAPTASSTAAPNSPLLDTLLQPVSDDQQPLPFDAHNGASAGNRSSQKRRAVEINGLEDLRAMGLPRAVIRQKGTEPDKEYDYAPLYTGEKVIELWRQEGDTLIYLCSKGEQGTRQPSFFVSSHVLSSKSDFFLRAISPIWQADNEIDVETYPGAKYSLYFGPDKSEDRTEETDPLKLLRHYIIIRNVFACMFESTCVELEGDETLLTDIADRMLMYFEGSDVGVAQELGSFITRSGLWDVRNDPVKALDLLIFASRYKIENLYKEAFAHVVGMLPRVQQLDTFELIDDGRLLSLIDEHHSIMTARLNMAMGAMHEFHFKKMWAPNAAVYSTNTYITWRSAYEDFRKFLYSYYTETDGRRWVSKELNRTVARDLHDDFCALFDLLVNRNVPTYDATSYWNYWKEYCRVLAAHDKTLNEQPALPYGIPRLPGPDVTTGTPADGPEYNKNKLDKNEVALTLPKSYNNHRSNSMPIVKEFKAWEKKTSVGKRVKEIAERRRGYWLLIYAVLSSLAEVVVEDDITFGEDVEYFLCAETRNIKYWEGDEDEDGANNAGANTTSTSAGRSSMWGGMFTKNKRNQAAAVNSGQKPGDPVSRRCTRSYCWTASDKHWHQ